jgi:hypothetical protein
MALGMLATCNRRLLAKRRPVTSEEFDRIVAAARMAFPYGELSWVDRFAKLLKLGLIIRPCGRRRRASQANE